MSELVTNATELRDFLYVQVEQGIRGSYGSSAGRIADYTARTLTGFVNRPEMAYRRGDGQELPIELFVRALDEDNPTIQRQRLQTLGDRLLLLLSICPDYFRKRVGDDNLRRYRELGEIAYSMVSRSQPFEPVKQLFGLVSMAFAEIVDVVDDIYNHDRRIRDLVTDVTVQKVQEALPVNVLRFTRNLD